MARPLRILYPGAYYHVTCRGNAREKIFVDETDLSTFLDKLALSLDIYSVMLLAYVCMPNHFHLLLTTAQGNLPEFMRHFNISYTYVFNHRHRRVGHLYQGRYKAYLIDADSYLLEVSRYIHLNPVRREADADKPLDEKWKLLLHYKWSSLPGYLSAGKRNTFISYKTVLEYMGGDTLLGRDEYRRFIRGGLEQKTASPLEIGSGHGIIGASDFIERIKERFLEGEITEREQPAVRQLQRRCEPEELIERYARLTGKKREEICRSGKKSVERAMLIELLYRFCRLTQPEIGKLVGGIDYSAVSNARRRLNSRMEQNSLVREKFEKIVAELSQM